MGKKEIPVPIPITSLYEAWDWIGHTLVKQNSVVTKFNLNDNDVLELNSDEMQSIILDESSKLEVKIESPWDLAINTLDVIRDLASAIETRLQEIAVQCWESTSEVHFARVRETDQDLNLIIDLIKHINGIMDYSQKDMAPVNGLSRMMLMPLKRLKQSIQKCDWKNCSVILLNRIEPILKELVKESDILQMSILSTKNEQNEQQGHLSVG